MNKSEDTKELATALAKAQGEISDAAKDATNPFFNSTYATLAAVLQVIRPVLSKNGLAIVQTPWTNKEGANINFHLNTTILHSSGQWISGDLELLIGKKDMQGIGSAISYARRYMASAMAGLTQEDDDAESAKTGQKGKGNQSQQQNQETPAHEFDKNENTISPKMAKDLWAAAQKKKVTAALLQKAIKREYDVEGSKDLKVWMFNDMMLAFKDPKFEAKHLE